MLEQPAEERVVSLGEARFAQKKDAEQQNDEDKPRRGSEHRRRK
jgi:hypothetical protein